MENTSNQTMPLIAVFLFLGIFNLPTFAADANKPKPMEVIGTVEINNFPGTQDITGMVTVENLPAVQSVSGTVNVANFPDGSQSVIIDQSSGEPVHVGGSVEVTDLPEVTIGDISQTARMNVKLAPGTEVSVNNLDQLSPVLVRGGEEVITPSGDIPEILPILHDVVLTDLVVFSASGFGDCLVEIGEQTNNGWVPFFSFMPEKGLNQMTFNSGLVPKGVSNYLLMRVSNEAGQCGASLLWTGYELLP